MRCACSVGIWIIAAWASCCFAGEDTLIKDPVQLARKFSEVNQKKIEVYRTIKDDTTALAAKSKLAEVEREVCVVWISLAISKGDRKFELAMENATGLSEDRLDVHSDRVRALKVAPRLSEIEKEIQDALRKESAEICKRLGIDLAQTNREAEERERRNETEPPFTSQRIEEVMAQVKDDPEYLFPNRQAVRKLMDAKVGDWIKVRSLYKTKDKEDSDNITWYTIVGMSETRAMVQPAFEVKMGTNPPTRRAMPAQPAKFSLEGSKLQTLTMRGTRTASGKEDLKIGQKTFTCDWTELKSVFQPTDAVTTTRIWTCPDAPFNGVLKQISATETPGKGQTSSTLIEVIDFGQGAAAPPAAVRK